MPIQATMLKHSPKHISLAVAGVFLATSGVAAQPLLTLDEAVRIAMEQNRTIQLSRNDAAIGSNNATAGNAGFLPKLDLAAGIVGAISNTHQRLSNGDVTERTGASSSTATAGLTASWTVFDGFRMFNRNDQLDMQRDLASLGYAYTREQVHAAVVAAYFDVVAQQRALEVLSEGLKLSEDRVRLAQTRYEAGNSAKQDLLQARVDLNADRSAQMRQEADLANARTQLNVVLARPVGTEFSVADTIPLAPALDYAELERKAIDENLLLSQLRLRIELARVDRRLVDAARYPKLAVSLGYNFQQADNQASLIASNRTVGPSYGVALSMNLFDGFNTNRDAENADVEIASSRIAYADAEAKLKGDLTVAYASYRNRMNVVTLERENLAIARENLDLTLVRFNAGAIIPLQLREAQTAYVAAGGRLLTAEYEAKIAETNLLELSGAFR
ncbi:MAG: TolC family protein [Bacteroidetes bacterium]|nr:TolC family protein [Bacteroidota bacterium]